MKRTALFAPLVALGIGCGSAYKISNDAAGFVAPVDAEGTVPPSGGSTGTDDAGVPSGGSTGTDSATTTPIGGSPGRLDASPPSGGSTGTVDARPSDVARGPDAYVKPVEPGAWSVPTGHPRIYLNAKQKDRLSTLVSSSHPAAKAFMDTSTTAYAYESWFSALKYQITGTASHCTYAVSTIDTMVSSEETKIASGVVANVAADSYLHVGGTIGDLALTLDYCWDSVTPAQRTRWLAYANQAVSNVWNPNTATWGGKSFTWSGWSIKNPSSNYYYSFLRATMLLGLVEYYEDPTNGPAWVKMFRDTKIGGELVPKFKADLVGGGSREGSGYGVSMREIFRMYDQWEQTTGQRIADLTPHTRESLAAMLHQIVPTYDRTAPVGDHARDSTSPLFDYDRDYANVLAWLYPTDPLAARLAYVFDASNVPSMGQGFMRFSDFIYTNPALTKVAPTDVYPLYRAAGTGNLYMRSGWTKDATWAHFMCGRYDEDHAHQDQGSFLIYKRGWLAYDQVINSRSGIVQTTTVHNLVRVDQGTTTITQKVNAKADSTMLALQDEADWTYIAADMTPVYEGRAAVAKMQREMVWLKPDVFIVFDRVDTSGSGNTRVWQLQSPVSPSITGRTAAVNASGSTLTVYAILPATSTLKVVDWKSADSDMRDGFRFEEVDSAGTSSLFLNVMALDGAVATAVADDITGQHGVKLTLKNGDTATVRFGDSTPGATVDWTRAGGTVVTSGARTVAVEALPLLK
jgi:hypothetical protein